MPSAFMIRQSEPLSIESKAAAKFADHGHFEIVEGEALQMLWLPHR